MANIDVTLDKGITIGSTEYKNAVLREVSAQDVIEATSEAEKIVMVPIGLDRQGNPVLSAQLIPSPTMVGINVLRRQVVSIGPMTAPIDDTIWSKLSAPDLNILQRKAMELENAATEVALRGRLDRASEGDTQAD